MRNWWKAAAASAALASGLAFAAPRDAPVQEGTGGSQDPQSYSVTQTETVTTNNGMGAHPWTLTALGGVEGYSGGLASRIDLGATYGVALGVDPSPFLGFELGYSGAVNGLKNNNTGLSGPAVIRNGGYVAMTPGITGALNATGSASIKPYLLGGIGFDGYTAQNGGTAAGFTNQTVGDIPFGAGLQMRVDQFVANARFNYAWEFGNNQFQPFETNPLRYQGQLSVGAAF